jgi:glycosyltransferase involved in cell wall biosynthesis
VADIQHPQHYAAMNLSRARIPSDLMKRPIPIEAAYPLVGPMVPPQDSMTDTRPGPLIILSSHRSGSSSVMGLLVGMGLRVGEVLPARMDNPKGFFESVSIVNENRRILSSMDRDWTCPPRSLNRSMFDEGRLEMAIKEIAGHRDAPWGFKDPRTLFTLEAWLSVIDEARFLGVYRSAKSVARSLQKRDLFSQAASESIALQYNERLAELHRELNFPIVRFDGDRRSLLDRLEDMSGDMGLRWNPEFARSFFESEMIHHPAQDASSGIDEYLESAASLSPQLSPISADDALRALRRVQTHGSFASSSRHLGPRFLVRRSRLWNTMRRLGSEVGSVLELLPDDGRQFDALHGVDVDHYWQRPIDASGSLETDAAFTHILATDALEAVPSGDLEEFLAEIRQIAGPDGVAGISGRIVDRQIPDHFFDERTGTTFYRDRTPYWHLRDDVEYAMRRVGWHITSWPDEDGGMIVVARSASRSDPTIRSPAEMRQMLRQLSRERTELDRSVSELKRELAAAKRDYQHLRSRRTVRAALVLARPFKPVFQWKRRRKQSPHPTTRSDEEEAHPGSRDGDSSEVPYKHILGDPGTDSFIHVDGPNRLSRSRLPTPSRRIVHKPLRVGLFLPGGQHGFPPSTHVRILRRFYHPSLELSVSPVVIDAERFMNNDSPIQLDVAVVQRKGIPPGLTDDMIHTLGDREVPIVLDLDDDIIGMPVSHPDFESFRHWREPLERLAKSAAAITVSTESLGRRLADHNDHVVILPNALDSHLWFSEEQSQAVRPSNASTPPFRMLYFGSRTHADDLQLVEAFMRASDNSATLTVVGGAPDGYLDWCEHVEPPNSSREYPLFVQWLKSFARDFDAALAPLTDTKFNESKSDLKFLEATGLGLPVICSDVPAFAALRGRDVALLTGPSSDEWAKSISLLRDKPELREELVEASTDYVTSERLLEQQSAKLSSLLQNLRN